MRRRAERRGLALVAVALPGCKPRSSARSNLLLLSIDGALYEGWALRDPRRKPLRYRWRGDRELRASLDAHLAEARAVPWHSIEIGPDDREEPRALGYASP